jgi:hypothetical protein
MSANLDQDRVRWPGSGSAVNTGSIPFGFYLAEPTPVSLTASVGFFEYDCEKSAQWAAKRLGYPIIDIEMIDVNFYACFEESVNEYGAQINQFNIRNNLLNLQGLSTADNPNITGKNVIGTGLPYIIQLSKGYGSEIGVGGYVDIKKVPLQLSASQQTYDLQDLIGTNLESGSRVEIRRVFHGPPPAFARIYDPFSMTGMSYSNVLNEMGFAGYSPATQFLMTPIFEDLLRGQAIEFNDMVRKSAYSFEVVNNKLKIFPIPTHDYKIYIEYVVEKDKFTSANTFSSGSNYDVVSDYSNVPYQNVTYFKLNAVGKQWVKKYYLALCKEILGAVRQKYSTIPIPGGEVSLDGAELRSEASTEKEALITQLRENLEATSRKSQMEAKADETEKMTSIMKTVPLLIYIGVLVFGFILIWHDKFLSNLQYFV